MNRRTLLISASAAATGLVAARLLPPKIKAIPGLALDALKFKLKSEPDKITFVMVDCDRTLYTEDSTLEAAKRAYGNTSGEAGHKAILDRVKHGEISLDQGLVQGFMFLSAAPGGFKMVVWEEIMADYKRQAKFRMGLIDALLEMQAKGVPIIVATRGSEISAQWVAKEFGFNPAYAFGTRCETIEGRAANLVEVIGTKNDVIDEVLISTKLRHAEGIPGLLFNPARAAVIADDVLDAGEMLNAGRGILLVPSDSTLRTSLQKASVTFGLYDRKIDDTGDASVLKTNVLMQLA